MRRFAESLVKYRWMLLVLALGSGALAFFPARNVAFDRSIENMFAHDDPLLGPYRDVKDRFGGNEVVMLVYDDPQLFTEDGQGIDRVAAVTEKASQVDGVKSALSISVINKLLRPLSFGQDYPITQESNSRAQKYRQLFEGYTHGADQRTVSVVCMLHPDQGVGDDGADPRRDTIRQLRAIAEEETGTIAGEPVMVVEGFRFVEDDGKRLSVWTTILLAITIFVLFRSLRWVLIPVAVVWWSLLTTRGILQVSGLRLSMVSSMLTAIVTVVAVATIVHVIVRFRLARSEGNPPISALTNTLAFLLVPVAWACLTDAVGFASLLNAKVGPVHDFGIMMAVGSVMVLIGTFLLVPGLALIGKFDTDPRPVWGEHHLGRWLERVVDAAGNHRVGLLAAVVVLVMFTSVGLGRLEVESDFTRNFRRDSDVATSYRFVEERLGGAGVWDAVITFDGSITPELLTRVGELENELRAIQIESDNGPTEGLTKVISLSDATDGPLPLLQIRVMTAAMPEFMNALQWSSPDKDHGALRIMLRARERQSAEQKLSLIKDVETLVKKEFPDAQREIEADSPTTGVTGFYVLLANLIQSMLKDQWTCFLIATVGIGCMMLIAFRDWKLALVALVPNAMPILVVLGLMGWLNIKMNMGAAMIAAVSMGLSVDSSIHYITSFLRARRAGTNVSEALHAVQQTVGRAMVFSTIALIVGFTTLCASEFVPTIYFGALVSLSMAGGLCGNLVILPLLIGIVHREGKLAKAAEF